MHVHVSEIVVWRLSLRGLHSFLDGAAPAAASYIMCAHRTLRQSQAIAQPMISWSSLTTDMTSGSSLYFCCEREFDSGHSVKT